MKTYDALAPEPTRRRPPPTGTAEPTTAPDREPPGGIADPAASRLASRSGRGPGPEAIAALRRLHQTRGNRAVQRLVRREVPAAPLQRDGILPEWTIGDWRILPPKPTFSTSDKYDSPQNQARAEQREADERSGDQMPDEWKWWQRPPFGTPGPLAPLAPTQPGADIPGPLLPLKTDEPEEPPGLPPLDPEEIRDYPDAPVEPEGTAYA
jgi:hypothetical protein